MLPIPLRLSAVALAAAALLSACGTSDTADDAVLAFSARVVQSPDAPPPTRAIGEDGRISIEGGFTAATACELAEGTLAQSGETLHLRIRTSGNPLALCIAAIGTYAFSAQAVPVPRGRRRVLVTYGPAGDPFPPTTALDTVVVVR